MESPKNDLCTLDMKIWYAAFLFFINQDLFSSCNVKGDIEQKEVRECWTNVAVIQGEIVDAMSWPKSAIPPLRRNKAYLVKLKCLKCTNVQMYKWSIAHRTWWWILDRSQIFIYKLYIKN